jgi:hypothetical protein
MKCISLCAFLALTLTAAFANGYPVSSTFAINSSQSSLTARATTLLFSDTDTQNLSGAISATFDFGQTGAFPAAANITITDAAIAPNGPFNLRLGFPPIIGVNITASGLVADLSTPAPPGTMTRTGASAIYQFDASQFLLTIDQGMIVVTGTTNETTDLSQEPVTGVADPGTFGTIKFTTLGTSGPYTRLSAALDFPIDITDTAESDDGLLTVELQLTGAVRANASFFVALSGIPGDFEVDGDVDGADLPIWRSGFGLTSGASAANGNADADADVDGADFLLWQRNLGTRPPTASSASVRAIPEPATASLGGLALWSIATWTRRRNRI